MTGDRHYPEDAIVPRDPDAVAFVRALVDQGKAARATDGELPRGATHEILGETEDGVPIVRRVRFAGPAG
jgi:hypothetical protein